MTHEATAKEPPPLVIVRGWKRARALANRLCLYWRKRKYGAIPPGLGISKTRRWHYFRGLAGGKVKNRNHTASLQQALGIQHAALCHQDDRGSGITVLVRRSGYGRGSQRNRA